MWSLWDKHFWPWLSYSYFAQDYIVQLGQGVLGGGQLSYTSFTVFVTSSLLTWSTFAVCLVQITYILAFLVVQARSPGFNSWWLPAFQFPLFSPDNSKMCSFPTEKRISKHIHVDAHAPYQYDAQILSTLFTWSSLASRQSQYRFHARIQNSASTGGDITSFKLPPYSIRDLWIVLKYVALSLHTCMYSICGCYCTTYMYDFWAFITIRSTIMLAIHCYVSLQLRQVHHRAVEFVWLQKIYTHTIILRSISPNHVGCFSAVLLYQFISNWIMKKREILGTRLGLYIQGWDCSEMGDTSS